MLRPGPLPHLPMRPAWLASGCSMCAWYAPLCCLSVAGVWVRRRLAAAGWRLATYERLKPASRTRGSARTRIFLVAPLGVRVAGPPSARRPGWVSITTFDCRRSSPLCRNGEPIAPSATSPCRGPPRVVKGTDKPRRTRSTGASDFSRRTTAEESVAS